MQLATQHRRPVTRHPGVQPGPRRAGVVRSGRTAWWSLVFLVALTTGGCASPEVRVYRAPDFDVRSHATFHAGFQSAPTESAQLGQRFTGLLRELGLEPAAEEQAELRIEFHIYPVTTTVERTIDTYNSREQAWGGDAAGSPRWGWADGPTQVVESHVTEALVFTVTRAGETTPSWRGYANYRATPEQDPKVRHARLLAAEDALATALAERPEDEAQ